MTYNPDFPVKESVLDELGLVILAATVVVESKSSLDGFLLWRGEELGSGGIVAHDPERCNTSKDSDNTLKDEDPPLIC